MDSPEISDHEYDQLFKELSSLEDKFPEMKDTSSPTQNVGSIAGSAFNTVTHEVPMLSHQNTFEKQELERIDKRNQEKLKIVELISGKSNLDTLLAKLGEIAKENNVEFISISPFQKISGYLDPLFYFN